VTDIDPLGFKNTVWSGCKVTNNTIYGLVISVGKDTRLTKNSNNKQIHKTTNLDKRVNTFSFILFLMMTLLSFINSFF